MGQGEPAIRNISDTANWAAVYRARESERPDALFRDPFARRLAGERGERIFATFPARDRQSWAWVMRTYLFDQLIAQQVGKGADMVVKNRATDIDLHDHHGLVGQPRDVVSRKNRGGAVGEDSVAHIKAAVLEMTWVFP